jgi:hypothetical protein
MSTQELKAFLESFQDSEGKFISENSIKATAEYLLVHRFCPDVDVGNPKKARRFLIENVPHFALYEVKKGFSQMEKIWQIAVGIPEDTLFLSEAFLDLSVLLPPSVKSALLMVLLLQKVEHPLVQEILNDVVAYQKTLFTTVSLDTLYETTHNVMTFQLAREQYDVEDIIFRSCRWLLASHVFHNTCIDILAEAAAVTLWCRYPHPKTSMFSALVENQNTDGGLPVFAGGKSEFHPSLAGLWALTAE